MKLKFDNEHNYPKLDIFQPSFPPSNEPIMPMFWGCCHHWTWHYCCLMWGVDTRILAASNPGRGRHSSSSSVPISRPNEYCGGQDTAQPPQWGGGGEWMRIFREKYCQLMWTMSHKSTAISSCVSVWSVEAPSQLEQVFVGVWQTCKQCLAMLPKLSVPDAHWNFCKFGLGRSNLGKIG